MNDRADGSGFRFDAPCKSFMLNDQIKATPHVTKLQTGFGCQPFAGSQCRSNRELGSLGQGL